jgi:hypothetical protein
MPKKLHFYAYAMRVEYSGREILEVGRFDLKKKTLAEIWKEWQKLNTWSIFGINLQSRVRGPLGGFPTLK